MKWMPLHFDVPYAAPAKIKNNCLIEKRDKYTKSEGAFEAAKHKPQRPGGLHLSCVDKALNEIFDFRRKRYLKGKRQEDLLADLLMHHN